MIDIKEPITLSEFVKGLHTQKLWLCPRLLRDAKLSQDPLLQGIECTPSTIPEELRDKHVTRHFREGKTDCIIWENEE